MTGIIENLPKNSTAGRLDWKHKIPWIVISIAFAAPRTAFACAACTGRSDDAAAQGLNAAVFTLLLVLLTVYGAFTGGLVYLIRRAAKRPLTPPGVPAEPLDAPDWAGASSANLSTTVNRVTPTLPGLDYQKILRRRKEWYENGRN